MAKGLSEQKAKKMLKDKTVRGNPITAKQKRFFGFIAGGGAPTKLTGQAMRRRIG